MFVTDQLRQDVDKLLQVIELRADWLETVAEKPEDLEQDVAVLWATERALHVAVECVTDAANLVIDALVMREPGGYADIVRVVAEEGVVDRAWFHAFEGALEFRNQLARGYAILSAAEVATATRAYGALFRPFVQSVRRYLDISST